MRIYSHARAHYLQRVLNVESDQAGSGVKDFATEQITKAVLEPDLVYCKKDEMPPVHIRNGAAVPVDSDARDGAIPDTSEDETVIRTVYHEQTFLSKIENDGNRGLA